MSFLLSTYGTAKREDKWDAGCREESVVGVNVKGLYMTTSPQDILGNVKSTDKTRDGHFSLYCRAKDACYCYIMLVDPTNHLIRAFDHVFISRGHF